MIETFLKELRDSADIQHNIFTQGSCFRLYLILKSVFPDAEAHWSDLDNHCIIKVDNEFYDIGGKLSEKYITHSNYNKIPTEHMKGYGLLKYSKSESEMRTVKIQKYI